MMSQFLTIVLAAFLFTGANTLAIGGPPYLNKTIGDICSGTGDTDPGVYFDYLENDCPAKYKRLAESQICVGLDPKVNNCQVYCQIRTSFFYVKEIPFERPYCKGPLTCKIGSSDSVPWTYENVLQGEERKIWEQGVSGSVYNGEQRGYAEPKTVKLEEGECGYFTAVPMLRSSCGSITTASPDPQNQSNTTQICAWDKQATVKNKCDYTPHVVNGNLVLKTLFIRTDCATNLVPITGTPAPQSPVYNSKDVSFTQEEREEWIKKYGLDKLTQKADTELPVRR